MVISQDRVKGFRETWGSGVVGMGIVEASADAALSVLKDTEEETFPVHKSKDFHEW